MSEEQLVPDTGQMRASDADREKVARLLQQAHGEGRLDLDELDERLGQVYAARTYGELVPLTADLGMVGALTVPVPVRRTNTLGARIGGVPGPGSSIAIWSGVNRKGDWVVPEYHNVVAIMGGVELDLSTARFEKDEVTIQVIAFWGGVVIYAPEDVTVRLEGHGIMGAFEDNTDRTPTIPGGPVVRVTGYALMGGVEVRRPKKKKLKSRKSPELEG